MDIKERIIDKIMSGRFLVTVLLTIGFLIMVAKGLISGSEYIQIFSLIITFYFVRDKMVPNSDKSNNTDKEN